MQSLLADDLYWVRRQLARPVVQLMKRYTNKAVIAGGFIRSCVANELINDIDIFAPSAADAAAWAGELAGMFNAQPGSGGAAKVLVTQNAHTIVGIKTTVQIIHRWTYEKPEDVIGSFDFTIARAAIWWDATKEPQVVGTRRRQKSRAHKWQTMIDDRFYADLAARRLIYCSPVRNEDAGGSLLRVFKFYQRGYRMPLPSMGAVVARLLNGIRDNAQFFWDGENKGGSVASPEEHEKYRAKILTGLLREVDPNVDPDHIMHLPTTDEEDDDCDDVDTPVDQSGEPPAAQ